MNPSGMKKGRKEAWLDYHYNSCYTSQDLRYEYQLTNYYDESFEDWYKWKLKRDKRRTIQLRRKVLLHKILTNGYMAVNYV